MGLVVDDAIVMAENIYVRIERKGWHPKEAGIERGRRDILRRRVHDGHTGVPCSSASSSSDGVDGTSVSAVFECRGRRFGSVISGLPL